jgi:hypothetical protein
MKQLGTGLTMYAQDYDETLPLNDYAGNGLMPLPGWRDPWAGDSWCKMRGSAVFFQRHSPGRWETS